MLERSPKYGLGDATGTPVRVAAGELSRAINDLDTHHRIERTAWSARLDAVQASFDTADGLPDAARCQVVRLDETAHAIRQARRQLLAALTALREPLVDLLLDEHALHGNAPFAESVEPFASQPVPEHVDAAGADWPEHLDLLRQTLAWTSRVTLGNASAAYGPAYSISHLIPITTAAADLHHKVSRARDDLRAFPTLITACLR